MMLSRICGKGNASSHGWCGFNLCNTVGRGLWDPSFWKAGTRNTEYGNGFVTFEPFKRHPESDNIIVGGVLNIQSAESEEMVDIRRSEDITLHANSWCRVTWANLASKKGRARGASYLLYARWFNRFCSFLRCFRFTVPVQSSSDLQTSACWDMGSSEIPAELDVEGALRPIIVLWNSTHNERFWSSRYIRCLSGVMKFEKPDCLIR